MSLDRPTATRVSDPADCTDHPSALDAPEGRNRHIRAVSDPRRAHLNALLQAIKADTPFRARLVNPIGDFSYVRVVNFDAAKLAEDIGCRVEEDGDWWFTWSWGDTIGPAEDVNGTVEAIRRVLTSKD